MDLEPRQLGTGSTARAASAPAEDDEKYGAPVDPIRLVRLLWGGRWWLLGAFVLGAAIGITAAKLFVKPQYSATAMLRFSGLPPIDGLELAPADQTQTLGGLLQAIFVEGSLREIGTRMGLDVPNYVLGTWISVDSDPAQVVRITTKSPDAAEAARFANTVVDVFLERQKDAQGARIREAIASLAERVEAAETAVSAARTTYDTFRRDHGIADLTTEQETAIEQAAELRAQRDRTSSEISALEARIEQLRRDLRTTPRTTVASASVAASAEEVERARLQTELAGLRGSLSDDHPRIQAIREQINALDQRISSGQAERMRTATATTSSQYVTLQSALSESQADLEAARQRLEAMTRLASEAQERVEQFSNIEGDATRLLAEVRVNEQLLQELQARKARLEDALRDPEHGFVILGEAVPPELPEASKKKYFVAGGVPAGLLFLVLVILVGRELKGLRLRSPKEVAFWGKGPVIASSSWPRVSDAIDDLVAGLDDFVPSATGRMLVVSVTPESADLALQFSTRLGSDWMDTTMVGGSPFDEPEPGVVGGYPSLPPTTGASAPLALRGHQHHVEMGEGPALQVEAWQSADTGPALRRAARLADRVCVVVPVGSTSALVLKQFRDSLGRRDGVGYVVVDVDSVYLGRFDRVGPVERFWACVRE